MNGFIPVLHATSREFFVAVPPPLLRRAGGTIGEKPWEANVDYTQPLQTTSPIGSCFLVMPGRGELVPSVSPPPPDGR